MKRLKNNNDVVVHRLDDEDIESLIERFIFRMKKYKKQTLLPQDIRFKRRKRKGAK